MGIPTQEEEGEVDAAALSQAHLIAVDDPVGCVVFHIRHCKDFSNTLVLKKRMLLVIRITVGEVMKCTMPHHLRELLKMKKSKMVIPFEEVKYFCVQIPRGKNDVRNKVIVELLGIERMSDSQKLLGRTNLQLIDIVQQVSVSDMYELGIKNLHVCNLDMSIDFSYGYFGYGYSNQLKRFDKEKQKIQETSLFLRIPPLESRKDQVYNVITYQPMPFPAFLPDDLHVSLSRERDRDRETMSKEPSEYLTKVPRKVLQHMKSRKRLDRLRQELNEKQTQEQRMEFLEHLILRKMGKSGKMLRSERKGTVWSSLTERKASISIIPKPADLTGSGGIALEEQVNERRSPEVEEQKVHVEQTVSSPLKVQSSPDQMTARPSTHRGSLFTIISPFSAPAVTLSEEPQESKYFKSMNFASIVTLYKPFLRFLNSIQRFSQRMRKLEVPSSETSEMDNSQIESINTTPQSTRMPSLSQEQDQESVDFSRYLQNIPPRPEIVKPEEDKLMRDVQTDRLAFKSKSLTRMYNYPTVDISETASMYSIIETHEDASSIKVPESSELQEMSISFLTSSHPVPLQVLPPSEDTLRREGDEQKNIPETVPSSEPYSLLEMDSSEIGPVWLDMKQKKIPESIISMEITSDLTTSLEDVAEKRRTSSILDFEDEGILQLYMPELESDVTSEASALLSRHPLSRRDFVTPETSPNVREREEIEQWEMIFQQSLFKPEVSHKKPLTEVNDDLEQVVQHPESQTPTDQRKRIPIVVVDTNFPDTWFTSGEVLSGIPHPQKQLGRHENLPQSTPITGWDSDSELKTENKMLYLIDTDLPKTWTKPLEIQDIKDPEGNGTLALSELQLEYEKKNAQKAHRPAYTKSLSSASSLNVSEIESEAEEEAGDELLFWGYQRRAHKASTPSSLTDISTFVSPMASESETDLDENAFRTRQEYKQSLYLPQSNVLQAGSLSDADDEFLMSLKSYKKVLATLNFKTDVNRVESNEERKVNSKSEEQTDQELETSISYCSDLDQSQQPISGETSEGESEQLGVSPLTRQYSLDWSSINVSLQSIVVQQEKIEIKQRRRHSVAFSPSTNSLPFHLVREIKQEQGQPPEPIKPDVGYQKYSSKQDEVAGTPSELPVPQKYLSRRQSVDVNALSLSPATFVNPEEDGNQDDAEESSAQASAAQRFLSRRRSVDVNTLSPSLAAFVNPEEDENQDDAEESSAQTSAAQRYLSRRRSVDVNTLSPSPAAFVNPEEDENQDDAEESSAQTSAAQRYLSRRRSVGVNSSATFINPEGDGNQDDAEESSAQTSAAQRYLSRRRSVGVNSSATFINPEGDGNQDDAEESSAQTSAAQRYLSRRRSVGVNSSATFINPEGDGKQDDAEESSAKTSAAQRYLSRRRSVDVNTLSPSLAAFVNPEEDENQDDAEESSAQTSAAQRYLSRRRSVDVNTLSPSLAAFVNPEENENQDDAEESSAQTSAAQRYLSRRRSVDVSSLRSSLKAFLIPQEDGNQNGLAEGSSQSAAAQDLSDSDHKLDLVKQLSSGSMKEADHPILKKALKRKKHSARRHTMDWSKLEADKDRDESKFTKRASTSKKSSRKRFSLDLLNYRSSLKSIQSAESDQDGDEGRKSPRFSFASDVTGQHSKTKATAEEGEHQGSSQQEQEPPTQPDSSLDSVKRKLPKHQLPRSESESSPDQNETISKSPATADEVNREKTEQQEGDGGQAVLESDSNPQISEAEVSGKVSDTSSDQAATKVLGQAPEGEDIFEIMISSAMNELEMEASDTEEQRRHLKTGDRCKKVILFPEVVVTDRKQGILGFKMHRYVREQEKAVDKKHHKAKTGSTKGHSQQKATCRYVRKDEPSVERLDSERILKVLHTDNTVRVRGTNPEGVAGNTPSKQETQPRDGAEESAQKTSSQEASKKKPTQDD
ncbi:uncharacterized protein LOC122551910 [Chiloscyllium plagiosum]|uniref:uncharacterized protein LOC122551910 n=1 Tax=Chiloscyllium plagiosum TaxID=36176 RepID=UPI001CB8182C|nr:uncharacterized protein LOC122551910 [Chiloscyllium plagiosum]